MGTVLNTRVSSRIEAKGNISGTINGTPLRVRLHVSSDLKTGLARGVFYFDELPDSFNALAVSGLSLVSWKNNSNPVKTASAVSLLDLSGGKYQVRRQNIFPDGSVISLHFEISPENDILWVEGHWFGEYTLPTSIIHVEMPIIENLDLAEATSEGVVRGYYEYTLLMANGERFTVQTPSEYKFTPVTGLKSVPHAQKRTTVANWLWKDPRTLEIVSMSVMSVEQ